MHNGDFLRLGLGKAGKWRDTKCLFAIRLQVRDVDEAEPGLLRRWRGPGQSLSLQPFLGAASNINLSNQGDNKGVKVTDWKHRHVPVISGVYVGGWQAGPWKLGHPLAASATSILSDVCLLSPAPRTPQGRLREPF